MTRPKRKAPCPQCKSWGFTLSEELRKHLNHWYWMTQNERWKADADRAYAPSLEETLAVLRQSPLDCARRCLRDRHTPENPSCKQPRVNERPLLEWLEKHKYTPKCALCQGTGKVHKYLVIEYALLKATDV